MKIKNKINHFIKILECYIYVWHILEDDKTWNNNWWKVRLKLLKQNKI